MCLFEMSVHEGFWYKISYSKILALIVIGLGVKKVSKDSKGKSFVQLKQCVSSMHSPK